MPKQFSRAEHRTIAALASAIGPSSAHLPVSSDEVGVAGELDELLSVMDPRMRRMLKLMTTALRFAPLLAGKWRTLARLSREARETYLREALAGPRFDHDLVLTLRALCEMAFASDRRLREFVGDFNEPYKQPVAAVAETKLPVICYPELHETTTVDCDVAIVGSGAGGATVARVLAEAGISVVIIEEGGPVDRTDFQGKALNRIVKYYRDNGFTSTLGAPLIPVPMGRVVGGTTVVNSGTMLRAPDSVLEQWATRHGADLAAPEKLGAAYDEIEEGLNVHPVDADVMGNNGRVVQRGAEELGLQAGPIPRPTRQCVGMGQCAFGCPYDAKQGMHLTSLPAAVQAGARIYALCKVDRLRFQGSRVTAVTASILDGKRRPTGKRLTVRAKAVFLCAGAVHTPALLMRSKLRNRAVGQHLRIHPGSGITGRFDETIRGWQGVMQSFAIHDRIDEGFLLEATFPPLGMSYSAASLPGVGDEHARLLASYAQMASIGSIVSDTSTGRVRLLPGMGPLMQYSMNQEDVARMVKSIALSARVLFAAGATEVYPGVAGISTLRSAAEVDGFERGSWRAKDLKASAYHPMGTARIGAQPGDGVCDGEGRVHGADNLYVADTSLFPGSPHVNPQLTLMALCLVLSRRFVENWTRTKSLC